MRNLLSVIFCVALTTCIYGQSPNKMSYQSVVRNSSGQLVSNSAVRVRISILQGSANGNINYMETHSKTSNENGLVSLEIGGGTVVLGSFATIDWAAGPYFLKTETDPLGGTNYSVVGTTQLMSVPYALYAAKSGDATDNIWLKDNQGIYYNQGKVGIGLPTSNSGSSSAVLTVNGAIDQFSDNPFQTVTRFRNTTNNQEYQFNLGGSNNNNGDFVPRSLGIYNATKQDWIFNTEGNTSFLAVGSYNYKQVLPKSRLHVFNGDININEIGNGIIMKSPDGQCWRVTVSNTGAFVSTAISCP